MALEPDVELAPPKHRAFHKDLLNPDVDLFTPDFKRDSKGRYFMQLPGYGKWMVSVEPGSKIISQGSQDESGKPATDPASIRTGTLHAETVITIGDSIYLDGSTGCIHVGDYLKRIGNSISMCPSGLRGFNGPNLRFGFFLADADPFGNGDFFIGDITTQQYLLWDNSAGDLILKGDLIIQGDIQSANYVHDVAGYKLSYLTGNAEFQDVIVRGKVMMETGSSGSADYIAESPGRKWAAESGANITENHTSNNTANVSYSTALNVADGAARGLNAINASYRYRTWLTSSDMAISGVTTGPAVVMDRYGIYGWNGAGQNTFQLNSSTGDCMLRGTVYASAGFVGGWTVDADRIWNQLNSGGQYSKVELNIRQGVGVAPHIQVFSDSDANYGSPTGIQMTNGKTSDGDWPNSRLDVYDNGNKRVMLNKTGLYFFDTSGNITAKIYGGNSDGDVTFGGNMVRLWSSGIRVSYPGAISIASSSGGSYFRLYCTGTQAILESVNDSYGISMRQSNGSTNICTFVAGSITAYAPVRPDGNLSQNLGDSSRHWSTVYTPNLSYPGYMRFYYSSAIQMIESGSGTIWTFYKNGGDAYAGTSLSNMKLRANNNITLSTNGTIWLSCSTLSKPLGSFTIDHPLKPHTHFLQHSFVESPEMMNLYRGISTIVDGECSITMPDWFIALNGEDQSQYSYHLTSIGGQNDLWVSSEMDATGTVKFAGEHDGKFSYLITAVRNDPIARAKRIKIEPTKEELGKPGEYIYPDFYQKIRTFSGDSYLARWQPVPDNEFTY